MAVQGKVNATLAAAYIRHVTGQPCPAGTLRQWVFRGHIRRYGTALYDLGEIHSYITGEDPYNPALDAATIVV